ncbi:MAG: hypothetical protein KJ709_01930 [Nanoarchaeota archaeon]|nr:hypothetical protein [Nanoarchaeota archaeon]
MPDRQGNIDALVSRGFEVCPWEVLHYEVAGSTQIAKDSFNFYVGDDYVVGEYHFYQGWRDLRLIEDDFIVLMLENGFGFRRIDADSELEYIQYIMKFKGTDAKAIFDDLVRLEGVVKHAYDSIQPNEEHAKYNTDLVGNRFVGAIMGVLQPVPEMGMAEETYAARDAAAKQEMVAQMGNLMAAVKEGEKVKYGTIIDRIKFLGIKLHYDPGKAIGNIISGASNDSTH